MLYAATTTEPVAVDAKRDASGSSRVEARGLASGGRRGMGPALCAVVRETKYP
jgi:hypothetical protein